MGIIERHADVNAPTQRRTDMEIATAITAKGIKLRPMTYERLIMLSNKQLRIYRHRCELYGFLAAAREAVEVMSERGMARREDWRFFDWNPDTVREIMRPFEEVAQAVEDNQRKAWVETGGFARRAKDDPTRLWIDKYAAMKTPTMNAVFACHVKKAGDEPMFVLELDGATYATYGLDRLAEALREWSELASDGPATIRRLAA
jgi:hypothetical protein